MSVAEASSRAEQLSETYERLVAERDELEEMIAESPAREQAARAEGFRKSPTVRPGLHSPVYKERKRREDAERKLEAINADAATVLALLEEDRQEHRERELKRLATVTEGHRNAERGAWRLLGERFAELVDAYGIYRALVEEYEEQREGLAAGLIANADLDSWRASDGRHAVEPIPADLGAVVEALVQVSCDPGGNGYRDSAGQRYDDYGELVALLPDLRSRVENVVTLRSPRRSSSRAFQNGFEWGGAN